MKELILNNNNPTTAIDFKLPEQSVVELFVHNIGRSNTMRMAKVKMQKGLQNLKIKGSKLQTGTYVYVIKANQQQVDFGRLLVE